MILCHSIQKYIDSFSFYHAVSFILSVIVCAIINSVMSFVVIVVIVVFGSFTNSLALSLSRSLSLLHTHMFFADICNFDFISDFSQMCLFAVYLNAWLPFYYMHTCTFPCAIMQLILTEMVIYCVQYGSSISQNDSSRNIISLPSAIASLCVCVCVNALNGEKFLYDCNNYVQVKVTSCILVWIYCINAMLYYYSLSLLFRTLFFSSFFLSTKLCFCAMAYNSNTYV